VRAVSDNIIASYHEDVYEQWMVRVRFLGPNHFIINDPAGIRRVLIDNAANYVKGEMEQRITGMGLGSQADTAAASTPNGASAVPGQESEQTWRVRRRIMSPSFDYRSLPAYTSTISGATQRMLTAWDAMPPGTVVDVPEAMLHLGSEVISRILFTSESQEIAEVMARITGRHRSEAMLSLPDFIPVLNRLRRALRHRAERRMSRYAAASIDRVIERRTREKLVTDRDLLGRLMSMRDPETGSGICPEELRKHVITMFTAGHETVAQTLAWTWYLLSQHPEQEAKLHAELEAVLAGRPPSLDDLDRLPYTRTVIEEALRLYPPFHMLAWREAQDDDEVCGVSIPRGATVSVVPWVLHRHRKLWEQPGRFDPERFSPERSAERPRLAYLPFGVGPRVCIGAVFAMTEMTLIVATVAQRFQLRLVPGHKVEPQARLLLRANHGLPMTLTTRTH